MKGLEMKKKLLELVTNELKKIKETSELNLMISGGVDSPTLLAVMLYAGLEPDKLITVRLPYGDAHDEFDDMLKVVSHFEMEHKLMIVSLDDSRIEEVLRDATKIIGRPIPHYNIFPLYIAFERLKKLGVTDVIVGDGPDESMAGYTRHVLMQYTYQIYDIDGFQSYRGMIDKVLPDFVDTYASLTGKTRRELLNATRGDPLNRIDFMCRADMVLMRPDMMDMSHGLARHFGIKIHAPYEEREVDEFMFSLPTDWKMKGYYGKYLLRHLGSYLGVPKSVAWRKHKIGGPLVPVNKLMGWDDLDPYDKSRYLQFQKDVLNEY